MMTALSFLGELPFNQAPKQPLSCAKQVKAEHSKSLRWKLELRLSSCRNYSQLNVAFSVPVLPLGGTLR